MFVKMDFIGYENYEYYYFLIDTGFTQTIKIYITPEAEVIVPTFGSTMHGVAAIITEYKARNMKHRIIKAIVGYYRYQYNCGFWSRRTSTNVENDQIKIDKFFPELEYGELYYQSVKDLLFKKTNNIQAVV